MNLADQAHGHGQFGEPVQSVIQGPHVVDDLVHVLGAGIWPEQVRLGGQQILQRALRAFDLAGQHSFLAHVHEHEQIGVRQGEHGAVEPAQRTVGLREQGLKFALQAQRRVRRQGRGQEGPIAGGLAHVAPGAIGTLIHGHAARSVSYGRALPPW